MESLLWFMLLGFQAQPAPPAPPAKAAPPSRIAQVMKKLGINPEIYSKLGGVRNASGRATGSLLLSLDLSTGREDVLLEGQVWSPLSTSGDRLLVVQPDGVSAVSLEPGTQRSSRVNAWAPDVLLGTLASETTRVMGAVRSGAGAACQMQLATFRLDQPPSASPADDTTVPCSEDPSDVLRNGLRWRDRVFVRAAPAGGGRLQVAEVQDGQRLAEVYFRDLAIKVPVEGIVSRSDPVWVGSNRIAYVGSR